MCKCAKIDRCKNAQNCYDFEPLADYLCFDPKRYDNTTITKRKKRERSKLLLKNQISIKDQIYIALNDSIDDEAASVREIAAATGVDYRTIYNYIHGKSLDRIDSLVAILYAVGFKLEVVPLEEGGCNND